MIWRKFLTECSGKIWKCDFDNSLAQSIPHSSWHTPIYIDCTQHYFSQVLKFINPTVVFNISPFIDLNTMVLCVAVGVVLSFFSLPLHKIWILNCLPVGVSSCEFWKISYGITNGVEHGLFFLSYDWFFRGIINVRE